MLQLLEIFDKKRPIAMRPSRAILMDDPNYNTHKCSPVHWVKNTVKNKGEPKGWQTGYSPSHTLNLILTIFGVWGSLPDACLKVFQFRSDWFNKFNFRAVEVEIFPSCWKRLV